MVGLDESVARWTVACGFFDREESIDKAQPYTHLMQNQMDYVLNSIRQANHHKEERELKLSRNSEALEHLPPPKLIRAAPLGELSMRLADFFKDVGSELNTLITTLNELNEGRISYLEDNLNDVRSFEFDVCKESQIAIQEFFSLVADTVADLRNDVRYGRDIFDKVSQLKKVVGDFPLENKILKKFDSSISSIMNAVCSFEQNKENDVLLEKIKEHGASIFLFNKFHFGQKLQSSEELLGAECLLSFESVLLSLKAEVGNKPYMLIQLQAVEKCFSELQSESIEIENQHFFKERDLLARLKSFVSFMEESSVSVAKEEFLDEIRDSVFKTEKKITQAFCRILSINKESSKSAIGQELRNDSIFDFQSKEDSTVDSDRLQFALDLPVKMAATSTPSSVIDLAPSRPPSSNYVEESNPIRLTPCQTETSVEKVKETITVRSTSVKPVQMLSRPTPRGLQNTSIPNIFAMGAGVWTSLTSKTKEPVYESVKDEGSDRCSQDSGCFEYEASGESIDTGFFGGMDIEN